MTPIRLERNISKTAEELAKIANYYYQIVCCEAVRSGNIATAGLLVVNIRSIYTQLSDHLQ